MGPELTFKVLDGFCPGYFFYRSAPPFYTRVLLSQLYPSRPYISAFRGFTNEHVSGSTSYHDTKPVLDPLRTTCGTAYLGWDGHIESSIIY